MLLTERLVICHQKQADGRIETRILSGGSIVMDPPGIGITVEQLLG